MTEVEMETWDMADGERTLDGQWKARLFGCFDDPLLCINAFLGAPGLFGQNARSIDGSNCFGMCAAFCLLRCFDLSWILHMHTRRKLQEKYGLKRRPCRDCLVTAFCTECAINQEARELKARAAPAQTLPICEQPLSKEKL